MKLTRDQKQRVIDTLAANIRAETGTELSECCGDDEATVEAVQRFMREVSGWLIESHPIMRQRVPDHESYER